MAENGLCINIITEYFQRTVFCIALVALMSAVSDYNLLLIVSSLKPIQIKCRIYYFITNVGHKSIASVAQHLFGRDFYEIYLAFINQISVIVKI